MRALVNSCSCTSHVCEQRGLHMGNMHVSKMQKYSGTWITDKVNSFVVFCTNFCTQNVFLPCALHLLKMDKDEAFDTESKVFYAGNIKAECEGWCGWVDLEKVCSFLILRKVKETLFVLSTATVHRRKWEVTEVARISLLFWTSHSNSRWFICKQKQCLPLISFGVTHIQTPSWVRKSLDPNLDSLPTNSHDRHYIYCQTILDILFFPCVFAVANQ